MGGDLHEEAHGGPDRDALGERVARLETEVGRLRGELAALQAASPRIARADAAPQVNLQPEAARIAPAERANESLTNESLESQLGTRVLSKVAVVLLLAGVAWFLKWAFDNRWIGPLGRVAAGLLAGAGVVLWSERFRRQQLVGFSYALKAVGAGVLYLSLWASVQLYHLVPAPAAFAAMVAVTGWNAWLAWAQDAQLLAGYALLGAYLTPLLLRTGADQEVFLFSYLAAIAAALLVLLRLKPWDRLLLGALPATAAFFIAWYTQFFDPSKAWTTAGFALLLWAVFAAVPLLAVETESVIASAVEPLGAAAWGALTIYSVLAESGGREWEPWCALGFAAIYFALAWLLRSRSRRLAAAVHLAAAVVFVTLAISLKATGREITLGWLLEAVTLLILGFRLHSAVARWSGLVLLAATLIKTLAWDMRHLGTGYRVVSYLGLGVLLMVVSFAYQKNWLGLTRADARKQTEQNNEARG